MYIWKQDVNNIFLTHLCQVNGTKDFLTAYLNEYAVCGVKKDNYGAPASPGTCKSSQKKKTLK